MDAVGIFFFAIAVANVAAVWCIAGSFVAGPRFFNRTPQFKPGAVDLHSSHKGVAR
jgi:hypothetical protein